MALPAVFPLNPYVVPWWRWAGDLTEQLASYNVPTPVPEQFWQQWADQVCGIPDITALGAPRASSFASWQSWAAALMQVLN